MDRKTAAAEIRGFNRFYTGVIGVINRRILQSDFSLTEARVLFEVSRGGGANARRIQQFIAVDEGYLSRTVEKLISKGLILRKRSRDDGRVFVLSLSPLGKKAFRGLDLAAASAIESMIRHLSTQEAEEIVSNMRKIQKLLEKGEGRP